MMDVTLDMVVTRLNSPKARGRGWMALCPFHPTDEVRSLHVGPGYGFHCYACGAKGGLDKLKDQLDRVGPEYYSRVAKNAKHRQVSYSNLEVAGCKVVATYDYRNAEGALLYQVQRLTPKGFRLRRPFWRAGELHGWAYNLRGVRRVLYKLPELLARPDETVILVEGEQDADRLHKLGLLATSVTGGVQGWHHTDTGCLDGRIVVIIPDEDDPGLEYATVTSSDLAQRARGVVVLRLHTGIKGGDVSDWLDQGHNKWELLHMMQDKLDKEFND